MISTLFALFATAGASAAATDSCDFGAPHPDAPAELSQFEFLIGNHRVEARIWQGEAFSEGSLPAEWNGHWGLGGTVIIDEWFGPQPDPSQPQNRGANVRHYNAETGLWSMVWQATNGVAGIYEAAVDEEGVLSMWQTLPEPAAERFIYFEVYDDTHWARIDGAVNEDGTRTPQYRLDAYEVPCEG